MSKGVIYGLCDPDTLELRYVGKTTRDSQVRLKGHLDDARRHPSTRLHYWLRSLTRRGAKPSLLVLERTSSEKPILDEAERRWIREMRAAGARLCNLTDGGDGFSSGHTVTATTRRRISRAMRGKTKSAEHREKIAASLRGRKTKPCSSETRAKISATRKGKPCNHKHGCTCSFCIDPGRGAQIRWARVNGGGENIA